VGATMSRGLCVAVIMSGLLATGCFTQFNAHVQPDDKWQRELQVSGKTMPSVEVDMVGVNATEFQAYFGYSVTKWFTSGDSLYSSASKISKEFGKDHPVAAAVGRDADIWQEWRNRRVTHLFVMAHLPGTFEDKPGDADPRRLILRLNTDNWPEYCWGNKDLHIFFNAGKVYCTDNYNSKPQ